VFDSLPKHFLSCARKQQPHLKVLFPPSNKPDLPNRVVVTGAGIVTALGIGWSDNTLGFRTGRSALGPLHVIDVSRQRSVVGGEVNLPTKLPTGRLSDRRRQRWDRSLRLLWLAANEAWTQSGWIPGPDIPLVLGTTAAGLSQGQAFYLQALRTRSRTIGQPTRILNYLAQRQALEVAADLALSGPLTLISNACASGANALGHAWEIIRNNRARRVLAGGYEGLCQLVYAGFDSLQAISLNGCRPFDSRRDGLSLGEGAAVLALEALDTARERGATILGELAGYGASTDVHHLTQPHPEGHAARRAMTEACRTAGVGPSEVHYLNAHGTGTLLNDSSEAAAIRSWAGDQTDRIQVSSTKRCTGHLLGAAGAVEAALCLMALEGQWLPPMPDLREPDPACTFPLVRQPAHHPIDVVMSNSFGFGGANATLIFRRLR
jgi:3-oxoacyl-[acyl-carrier-protein] synthase II